MLKQYKVSVRLDGHYTIEDPKCPSYWRGSHCYDIDIPTYAEIDVDVWAQSEEEARELAEQYNYEVSYYTIEVDKVSIQSIKFVADLDRYEDETGVIEPSFIEWRDAYER